MDSKAKVANKIKHQMSKFSGIISKPFSKVKRRLIAEMLYGIQASKDVKLSNIARSLKEYIPLIKTEDRLSRNLDDIDFTDAINDKICSLASSKVLEDTVLALDPGDIIKPYAKKMENLCKVKDGSKHEKSDGYWLCQVVASNMNDNDVVPMYNEAFSHKAKGFESMNKQIIKSIDTVSKYVENRGIWAIDRGGDNILFFKKFLKEEKRFPGNTTMDSLEFIRTNRTIDKLKYDTSMGGNGASMRTGIIGIINHKESDVDLIISQSITASRVTHNYSIGFLGGLVASLFANFGMRGIHFLDWFDELFKLEKKIDEFMKNTNINNRYIEYIYKCIYPIKIITIDSN